MVRMPGRWAVAWSVPSRNRTLAGFLNADVFRRFEQKAVSRIGGIGIIQPGGSKVQIEKFLPGLTNCWLSFIDFPNRLTYLIVVQPFINSTYETLNTKTLLILARFSEL
jgi:hypothetical protein